jgi:hypothetical protein
VVDSAAGSNRSVLDALAANDGSAQRAELVGVREQ